MLDGTGHSTSAGCLSGVYSGKDSELGKGLNFKGSFDCSSAQWSFIVLASLCLVVSLKLLLF